jgi:hypothetical protein
LYVVHIHMLYAEMTGHRLKNAYVYYGNGLGDISI